MNDQGPENRDGEGGRLARASLSPAWYAKVLAGVALLGHFLLQNTDTAATPELLRIPREAMLILVLTGGGLAIVHGWWVRVPADGSFRLVRDRGLYPWIRHPGYMGDLLWYSGLAFYPLTVFSVVTWVLGLCCLVAQARHEDALMARHLPREHEAWRRRSGLLFPGLW